jgi:serine kinase of HPr protein (carbohydrate metabolism regulator)
MSDIQTVIIVRGKDVPEQMVHLAKENDIVLLQSDYSMFRVSGLLYEKGVKPVF